MKKKQVALCLAVSAMLMAGCTSMVEGTKQVEEPKVEAADKISEPENNDTQSEKENEDSGSKDGEEPKAVSGDENLEGSVVSINPGEQSVEVNEILVEEYDDGSSVAVELVGVGSTGNYISVQFTEDTVYTVRTVKNGGINPEDVSNRAGSFSDISEGATLHLKGSWEGEKFLASDVVIYDIK